MTSPTPRDALYGNPPSETYEPRKGDIQAVLEQIEIMAVAGSIKHFETDKDDLPSSGNTTGDLGVVLDAGSEGGVYRWSGSAWVKKGPLPLVLTESLSAQQAAEARDAAEAARDLAQSYRDAAQAARDAAITARNASQEAQAGAEDARDLAQNYRDQSRTYRDASQAYSQESRTYRDESNAHSVNAGQSATAAQLAALAATADTYSTVAAGLAATSHGETFAVFDGPVLEIYENDSGTAVLLGTLGTATDCASRDALAAATVPAAALYVRTAGYALPGDGGAALYRRAVSEPAHSGKVEDAGGQWWELAEAAPTLAHFGGFSGEDVTDALRAALTYAAGGMLRLGPGVFDLTDTVIVPVGTTLIGAGRIDRWGGADAGTLLRAVGDGTAARWTDIDGADAADDTPLLVAGGNGVWLRDLTLSGEWSAGLFLPCVKQCGIIGVSMFGFTDGCLYLDATWSDRNTTLQALHPTVVPSTGMNEFSAYDFWLEGGGSAGFGIRIQGTTRSGTAVGSSSAWLWGWGGTSDIRFIDGRLGGVGASGGCFSHDAQLYGATAFGQGVTLRDVGFRLSVDGRFIAKFDRSNRILLDGCYGETTGTNTAVLAVTTRTQSGSDGILRIADKINAQLWLDGVYTGASGSNVPWTATRCVVTHRANNGRAYTPNLDLPGTLSDVVRLRSFGASGQVRFADGNTSTDYLRVQPDVIRPEVAGAMALGTAAFPFSQISVADVITTEGELDLAAADGSGVRLKSGSESLAVFDSDGLRFSTAAENPTIDAVTGDLTLSAGAAGDEVRIAGGETEFAAFDEDGITFAPTNPTITAASGRIGVAAEAGHDVRLMVGENIRFLVGDTACRPGTDNTQSAGTFTYRYSQLYAGTATINTSDAREKQDIAGIADAILDAWATVGWKSFRFIEAVERKGAGARVHFGLIAQQIEAAFIAAGLDAFALGILCHDEWEDEETGEERDRYGVRYEEALALEAALMRRRSDALEARLAALEAAAS